MHENRSATGRRRKLPPGVVERHSKSCATSRTKTARCNCEPYYEAWVWEKRSKTKLRKTFSGKGAFAAAKRWRTDAAAQVQHGALQRETRESVRDICEQFLLEASTGSVLSRKRERYKPSVLRSYRSALELYIFPALGGNRLADVRQRDVQLLVDRLVGSGLSGSTVRNAIVPLQAACRYAVIRRGLLIDPTSVLELPAPAARRERAASVTEAEVLLAALNADDDARDVYAVAFYSGLRRGEIRALAVSDLHLEPGHAWIEVDESWDDVAGPVPPKSRAGVRRALCPEPLRAFLQARLDRTRRHGSELVFGPDGQRPFVPTTLSRRAEKAWAVAAVGAFLTGEYPRGVVVVPLGLHEARHTHASWLAAAGIPRERRGWWLGHAGEGIGARYEHELDGQLTDDIARLDAYLLGTPAEVIRMKAVS